LSYLLQVQKPGVVKLGILVRIGLEQVELDANALGGLGRRLGTVVGSGGRRSIRLQEVAAKAREARIALEDRGEGDALVLAPS